MKTMLIILVLVLSGCGGGGGGSSGVPTESPVRNAQAQTPPAIGDQGLQAITMGVQWPTGTFNFASNCKTPNSGGVACFYFPNGGKLRAISWESSVKLAHDEILLMLVMSPTPAFSGSNVLLSVHHNKGNDPGSNFKHVNLNGHIYIPPGHYVWIYAEGTVNAHPAGVEVQSTLYAEGVGVSAVFP